MITRLTCLILGHRRLVLHTRILDLDLDLDGTLHPYLDLGCERCHR